MTKKQNPISRTNKPLKKDTKKMKIFRITDAIIYKTVFVCFISRPVAAWPTKESYRYLYIYNTITLPP